ncbi:MAG TPA: hypothetical protein VFY40_25675 [Blastocatellia bacterium]|nr:hypothetical protein [Blastocatellia bacterium]
MQTSLRILLLEDNPLDARLIEETLRSDGVECETERVDTREGFIAALEIGQDHRRQRAERKRANSRSRSGGCKIITAETIHGGQVA